MTLLSLLQGYNDLKMQDQYVEQHRFQKPAGGIMSRAGEEHLHGGVAGATTQALLLQLHSHQGHARGAGGRAGGGRAGIKPRKRPAWVSPRYRPRPRPTQGSCLVDHGSTTLPRCH